MVDLNNIISLVMKSKKAFLGSKQALKASKSGKTAALILASNCKTKTLITLKNYAKNSKIPVYIYPSSRADLGAACGVPFPVSVLAIRESNDPEIVKIKQELNKNIN